MRFALLASLTLIVGVAPAVADDKKPDNPDKKICISEAQTGSLFDRRVCHTKAEWKEINDANHAAVEQSRQVNATAR